MRKSGFTLLELSIVMIIIALLAASVLAARHMIRASQVRAMTGEISQFTQAVVAFRDKYQSLPGDFADAEGIWVQDAGKCGVAATYSADSRTKTCNGDGNGHIGDIRLNGNTDNEIFRAWQQLTDAAMLPGSFSGRPGSGSARHAIPGNNVPIVKLQGAGVTLAYLGGGAADATYWLDRYDHAFIYGSVSADDITNVGALTPLEAITTDSKVDDGFPQSGNVTSIKDAVAPGCATTTDPNTAAYVGTDDSTPACALIFQPGF